MTDETQTRPPQTLMREVARLPILIAVNRDGDDLGWHGQAACAGLGDVMFPKARDGRFVDYRDAQRICLGTATTEACPVLEQCLAWALDAEEPHGCWGGTTPPQRAAMLRARQGADGHGTEAGYYRHQQHDEPPCARCRGAMGAVKRYADEAAS